MSGDLAGSVVVTGRYELVPNPCTTEPCLPGLVCAVSAADGSYILTKAGRWLPGIDRWGEYIPTPGDEVVVVGRVTKKSDLRGDPYVELEIEKLERRH